MIQKHIDWSFTVGTQIMLRTHRCPDRRQGLAWTKVGRDFFEFGKETYPAISSYVCVRIERDVTTNSDLRAKKYSPTAFDRRRRSRYGTRQIKLAGSRIPQRVTWLMATAVRSRRPSSLSREAVANLQRAQVDHSGRRQNSS